MGEHGEELVLAAVGVGQLFRPVAEFLLEPESLDAQPDLSADGGEHIQEVVVRLLDLAAEELDRTDAAWLTSTSEPVLGFTEWLGAQ